MPEDFADLMHGNFVPQHEAGRGVSSVVQSDSAQPGPVDERLEPGGEELRMQRRAQLVGEAGGRVAWNGRA